jgi:hypothetical protein
MIPDPLKLKLCNPENSYYKKGTFHKGSSSLIGAKLIYNDTTIPPFFDLVNNYTTIITSFICKNQLLHLCVDSTSTYISSIENGKIKKIQIIGNNYRIFNEHNSYRKRIQKDNSQLLKFSADNNRDANGLIEICGNDINIRYLNLIK